jgi:hypothetical protein
MSSHTKAMAWAKPSQSQAPNNDFGLAWYFGKPRLPQAKLGWYSTKLDSFAV